MCFDACMALPKLFLVYSCSLQCMQVKATNSSPCTVDSRLTLPAAIVMTLAGLGEKQPAVHAHSTLVYIHVTCDHSEYCVYKQVGNAEV